jgi:membrane protease YdiL (CAAX protease family)
MENDKKALKVYLFVTFAISAIIEGIWIYFVELATQAGISTLLMCIPLIVAIFVSWKFYKKQNALGFNSCKFVYIILAVLIPLIYLILSYGLFWLFAKGSYIGNLSELIGYAANYSGKEIPDSIAIIISLVITFIVCVITALGEEVGWRGLMYPVMQRIWGWKKAIILSGCIWAVWHLPLVIAGLYLPDTVMIYRVPAFIIEVFALTVIITWIRMKSNSVWTAMLFHAIHNYLDQVILQSLTKNTNSAYFVGETGIITIFFTVLIAVFILVFARNTFYNNSKEGV